MATEDSTTLGRKSINNFYKVFISGSLSNKTIDIVAEMPEELNINIEQEWENPFKLALNDKIQGLAQAGLQRVGSNWHSLMWDHEQLYTYMGGSPLQMTFEIIFTAYSNVNDEIVKPVKALMQLASPSTTGSLKNVNPPPKCRINIGKMLKLTNVIITNVNPQFVRPLVSGTDGDFEGAPMRVPVNLTIQTVHLITQSRIDSYFFPGTSVLDD